MSSIIKLRAWLKKEKKMVFVSSIDFFYPTGMVHEFMYVTDDLDERVSGTNAEIMRYIGLKDKNKKEVYEGDILDFGLWKNEDGERAVVEYYEKRACFIMEFYSWYGGEGYDSFHVYQGFDSKIPPPDYAVIGNIYKNSEFLNK